MGLKNWTTDTSHPVSSFHSTDCPSEWGALNESFMLLSSNRFPFNWLPQRVGLLGRFHERIGLLPVSIQLIAPASGALSEYLNTNNLQLFPFNWLPQRVGLDLVLTRSFTVDELKLFPFNWLPQRVGPNFESNLRVYRACFHSTDCPSEWGHDFLSSYKVMIIKFPFNWLPQRVGLKSWVARATIVMKWKVVSIQLIAPASGAVIRMAIIKKIY